MNREPESNVGDSSCRLMSLCLSVSFSHNEDGKHLNLLEIGDIFQMEKAFCFPSFCLCHLQVRNLKMSDLG